MKLIALLALVATSLTANAAPKIGEVFAGVTHAQPKCYGREYSRAELAKHPKQTVEMIKAKLLKYSADPSMESRGMKIEVRLKGQEGLNFHAEFSCHEYDGKLMCGIDCDGGSVDIAQFDPKTMTLKNNGFVVAGGCGEDEQTKFLKALKGGDDLFKLTALPQAFCSDASAVYE